MSLEELRARLEEKGIPCYLYGSKIKLKPKGTNEWQVKTIEEVAKILEDKKNNVVSNLCKSAK